MTPESKLKRDCRSVAVQHGCKLYPAAFKGRRGFPDHLLLCPGRAVVLVEFKAKGGLVSGHQRETIEELRRAGMAVWVIWTKAGFEDALGDVLG